MSEDDPRFHMPEAEAEAVRAAYHGARRIVEYGSGGSTVFAATRTDAQLVSIESDPAWRDKVAGWIGAEGADRPGIELRHVDIGPVGGWGVPAGPGAFRRFPSYPLSPWVQPPAGWDAGPDLVFIDGRFRVACMAATVLNAAAPLTVLWDDYADRPGYHAAEELAGPPDMIGRLARFSIVPRTLTPAQISRLIPWFVIPA